MSLSRAERRKKRQAVIARRLKVAKMFGWNYRPGQLAKHNMSCTCAMCDVNRPWGVNKRVASYKEKQITKELDKEIATMM